MSQLSNRLLVIGGGGHAKVVIEILRANQCEPVGILDPHTGEQRVLGVAVLGGDEQAERLFAEGFRSAVVAIGDNSLRRMIADRLKALGFALPQVLHPSAVISPSATLDEGIVVMANAVVNARASIGAFSIVNTGAIIEHDCVLGIAVHAAPRSVMGGNVVLDDEVLFGIGAVARPRARIGARSIVGAGAVVIDDIEAGAIVTGVPARSGTKSKSAS